MEKAARRRTLPGNALRGNRHGVNPGGGAATSTDCRAQKSEANEREQVITMTDRGFLKLLNGAIILSLVLIVGGLIALPAAYRRDRSTGWPTATGVVAAAALRLDHHKP